MPRRDAPSSPAAAIRRLLDALRRRPERPMPPAVLGDLPRARWRIAAEHPHDPRAFTQGLAVARGLLYESTGLYGHSGVRAVDRATGRVVHRRDLDRNLFGEGLAVVGDEVVQLTWRAGRALRWDVETLAPVGQHAYAGEGWGLTYDGRRLLMSDGSHRLTWRDPATFAAVGALEVTARGIPLAGLNDLAALGNDLLANLYPTDLVARIDAASGEALELLDLGPLARRRENRRRYALTNGLAVDPASGRLLVTGKRWRRLYELEL